MNVYYDELATEIGSMTILMTEQAVLRVDYGTHADLEAFYQAWLAKHFTSDGVAMQSADLDEIKNELSGYFAGEREEFSFAIQLVGTDFQKQVWQALVDEVAYGKTVSYKQIAEAIRNPKAVRAVGGAVNKNPLTIVVPCHRVIGTNGKMVGYNGGLDKKEFLLQLELERMFAENVRQKTGPLSIN